MDKTKIGTGETVLITGASSGIGEALAACFAKGGFDLVLVARSVEKLETLAGKLSSKHKIAAWVEPADLAKPGGARKLAAAMKRRKLSIDWLVNNAGVLEHGAFAAMPDQRHQELIGAPDAASATDAARAGMEAEVSGLPGRPRSGH